MCFYELSCHQMQSLVLFLLTQSCSELLEATKKGNYEDLGRHLLGLVSSYDIDGDK